MTDQNLLAVSCWCHASVFKKSPWLILIEIWILCTRKCVTKITDKAKKRENTAYTNQKTQHSRLNKKESPGRGKGLSQDISIYIEQCDSRRRYIKD